MVKAILKEVEETKKEIEETKEVKIRVISALLIFVLLILGGGFIYSKIEYYPGTLQPWTYLDGVYFATTTVTTIGYGDLTPITTTGKIFTIFYSFIGIAITIYTLFVIGRFLMHYKIIFLKTGLRNLFKTSQKSAKKDND